MNNIVEYLLNLLFPKTCTGCSEAGSYICRRCILNNLELLHGAICPVCRQEAHELSGIHEDCKQYSYLDGLISVAKPAKILKSLLHQGKYGFQYKVYEGLGELLYLKCLEKGVFTGDCVVSFVPLAKPRQKWRGFNQAELLANKVSELAASRFVGFENADNNEWVRLNCAANLLSRHENNTHQVGLSRAGRLENLQQEFYMPKEIISRYNGDKLRILLIDDVYTTGATLQQAAKAIKAGLPKAEVFGCVLMQA